MCGVAASGDQLKQKLDNLSDVSDNVRDRGTLLLAARLAETVEPEDKRLDRKVHFTFSF